mgnify:CR=1 FL=1|jgi:hypothetical protein
MLKFRKSEIKKVAEKITRNSELFGDEVSSVVADLTSLSNSANELGCELTGEVSDYWGGKVFVTAIPDKRKHQWIF